MITQEHKADICLSQNAILSHCEQKLQMVGETENSYLETVAKHISDMKLVNKKLRACTEFIKSSSNNSYQTIIPHHKTQKVSL